MITDRRTGLTWCAFDSYLDLNQCLNYTSTIHYVERLRYGGYDDWRLPSAAALRVIYKRMPFFPTTSEGPWYWTSDQFGEYMVPVVSTEKKRQWRVREIETSIGCGAVRAVRGP
jgi:hypothetical protein